MKDYTLKEIRKFEESYKNMMSESLSMRHTHSHNKNYYYAFNLFLKEIKSNFKKRFSEVNDNPNQKYTDFTKIRTEIEYDGDDGFIGNIFFEGDGTETVKLAKQAFEDTNPDAFAGHWEFHENGNTSAVVAGELFF